MKTIQAVAYGMLAVLLASPAMGHEAELIVGQSATGQLKIHADFHSAIELQPSIFPGINGHAFAEPAFHSTIIDEPGEDLFQLSLASSLRFMLLAKDPGMEVWNDTGSAFMPVGGAYFIGAPIFDTHPMWNITSGVPGNIYTITVKVFDVNGIHSESDPLVLSFTPVPEPGALALWSLAALTLTRRRRCL